MACFLFIIGNIYVFHKPISTTLLPISEQVFLQKISSHPSPRFKKVYSKKGSHYSFHQVCKYTYDYIFWCLVQCGVFPCKDGKMRKKYFCKVQSTNSRNKTTNIQPILDSVTSQTAWSKVARQDVGWYSSFRLPLPFDTQLQNNAIIVSKY